MTVPSKRIQPADRQLLEYIFKLSQDELHKLLFHYLSKYYKNPVQTEDYIYAEGNIPIALVAHLDTVFDNPPKHIFFDHDQDVMWSPNGMGADDRAGVFAIIKIISHGFRPHIIFTHDEELGGDGAFFIQRYRVLHGPQHGQFVGIYGGSLGGSGHRHGQRLFAGHQGGKVQLGVQLLQVVFQ